MNHEQSCMRQCFIMFHTEMSHAGQLHILSNRRMCVGWVMHWDKRGQQDRKLAHKLLLPWPTSVTAGYTDLSCFPFLMEHYGERGTAVHYGPWRAGIFFFGQQMLNRPLTRTPDNEQWFLHMLLQRWPRKHNLGLAWTSKLILASTYKVKLSIVLRITSSKPGLRTP